GLNLDSSEPVLVSIVSICDFERERAIAITFPTAAEIDGFVKSSDFVVTADAQHDGVILTIADIRKSDCAQNRRIECTWCAQTVNSDGVVPAVLTAPLTVIDQTRRDFVQRKINHRVGANDHRVRSRIKLRHNALKNVVTVVEII